MSISLHFRLYEVYGINLKCFRSWISIPNFLTMVDTDLLTIRCKEAEKNMKLTLQYFYGRFFANLSPTKQIINIIKIFKIIFILYSHYLH